MENKIIGTIDFVQKDLDRISICEKFRFLRFENLQKMQDNYFESNEIVDVLTWLIVIINDYANTDNIPVICGYDMYNFTKSLLHELSEIYHIEVLAQNEQNYFYADIQQDGETLLRFWDVKKLVEEKQLQEETKTDDKLFSIPVYLRTLLKRNWFIDESDYAKFIFTKSSLTRIYTKKVIGTNYYINAHKHKMKLNRANLLTCKQELPQTFESYCMRKACFIGGYNFVSAKYSNKVMENVVELDVTSMHHAHICGHLYPVKFIKANPNYINNYIKSMRELDYHDVMMKFDKPFKVAFHANFMFKNIRLKKDSIFDKCKFGLIHREKFKMKFESDIENTKRLKAEENVKNYGYCFYGEYPRFAFGKLISAKTIDIWCNELEFWCINQVYDYDEVECLSGEVATNFIKPPDLITLQSNIFWKEKQETKRLLENYHPRENYKKRIPSSIPDYLKSKIKNGTASKKEIKHYYNDNVKSRFNTIFGNQAMDVFLPNFEFDGNELKIINETILSEKNFDETLADKSKNIQTWYNYGMRISSYSRVYLIIAMIILHESDPEIKMISGDTDSLHYCSKKQTIRSLKLLHDVIDWSIDTTLTRMRKCFPQFKANLKNLGHFKLERISPYRIDYANKMYMTLDNQNNLEMTFAGLVINPDNEDSIFNILQLFCKNMGFNYTANYCFGFNTIISEDISDNKEYLPTSFTYIPQTHIPIVRNTNKTQIELLNPKHTDVFESLVYYLKCNPDNEYIDRQKIISKIDGNIIIYNVNNTTGEVMECGIYGN